MLDNILVLIVSGLFSGLLAGILGIGGGTVLVPLLIALNHTPLQAVATSSLAIVITSLSGSIQNWRMGYFNWRQVILLGIPAIITAQLGVKVANYLPDYILLTAFGTFLIFNIFLGNLRRQLIFKNSDLSLSNFSIKMAGLLTGAMGGFLAGLFGIGGGVIMVPLQMLLLKTTIKVAIQTSLGVIVITSISSTIGHALRGNVLFLVGIILGLGGLVGAQISTRFLPRLPDKVVSFCFYGMLGILAVYIFIKAWMSYQ
ncbi:sulfite exporter TauE/SafE family protein [Crocosphaera sp. UHCC 0190]|uniref:sulfite exporter TauE/SafE family protein n=1 Tax=Crocosphaera sp. UHCC 0190 TaxID=3110246 RepID=UPI002B216197|nr:sulfite exporter TauE/SafE family protein [Crocosphaera sp. UHCC 0190]MEA5508953.1 sulfite exporter TauE/SafE family protein [Crocosphaera sp. UHCC 0190]